MAASARRGAEEVRGHLTKAMSMEEEEEEPEEQRSNSEPSCSESPSPPQTPPPSGGSPGRRNSPRAWASAEPAAPGWGSGRGLHGPPWLSGMLRNPGDGCWR